MIDGWCRKTAAIRDLLLTGQAEPAWNMVPIRGPAMRTSMAARASLRCCRGRPMIGDPRCCTQSQRPRPAIRSVATGS